ncbi:MAG: hypothetical protein QWI73_05715 [Alphaproteobacteria bacterium]|nr:hypothetical protein [Alphaproteobacteria bacterium]
MFGATFDRCQVVVMVVAEKEASRGQKGVKPHDCLSATAAVDEVKVPQ